MVQHRKRRIRLDARIDIAGGVRGYTYFRKDFVGVGILVKEDLSCAKAVNEQCLSTAAGIMREEVEDLKTGWIGEVRCVGVYWECEVSVCSIGFG